MKALFNRVIPLLVIAMILFAGTAYAESTETADNTPDSAEILRRERLMADLTTFDFPL